MQKYGVSGATLTVARGNTVIYSAAYGDKKNNEVFNLWSDSKMLTGVATLKMIQDGKFSESDRVGDLIPEQFANVSDNYDFNIKNITVSELLHHTSGLHTNEYDDPTYNSLQVIFRRGTDTSTIHPDEYFKLLLPLVNFQARPGEKYIYSNVNYFLLGRIVSKFGGGSYENYVKDTLLTPLGITSAEVDPHWKLMEGANSWRMTPTDELKFLECFEQNAVCPLKNANAILRQVPKVLVREGPLPVYYNTGLLIRPTRSGDMVWWHDGTHVTPRNGNIDSNSATLIVRSDLGLKWVIAYQPRPVLDSAARKEVDGLLWAAMAQEARPPK
jgi:CubicO group peptidase (beta-lactamase class C family)